MRTKKYAALLFSVATMAASLSPSLLAPSASAYNDSYYTSDGPGYRTTTTYTTLTDTHILKELQTVFYRNSDEEEIQHGSFIVSPRNHASIFRSWQRDPIIVRNTRSYGILQDCVDQKGTLQLIFSNGQLVRVQLRLPRNHRIRRHFTNTNRNSYSYSYLPRANRPTVYYDEENEPIQTHLSYTTPTTTTFLQNESEHPVFWHTQTPFVQNRFVQSPLPLFHPPIVTHYSTTYFNHPIPSNPTVHINLDS